MKLIYAKYGLEISLVENQVLMLVLEHPAVFTDFMKNLIAQTEGGEGKLILSEADKIFPFSKTVVLISNPLLVNCNEKRVLTKLYKELSACAKTELYEAYSALHTQMLQFLESLLYTVPYHLETKVELDMTDFLKGYDVRLAMETVEPLEQLIDYLRALSSICGIRVFVVLNLKQFFTNEQLQQLYEFCFYEKIHLIHLTGRFEGLADSEKCVIIDKDLCVITSE